MKKLKTIWAKQAKLALKDIYNYYKSKSLNGAKNVIQDLSQAPKSIHFSKQYQIDETNPNYRRIVIRDYKILYKEKKNTIQIVDIVNTKESPSKLKNK